MTPAISVIVFDVNETLSDISPMGERFSQVGAPAEPAKLWFATLLRDGFALTASGDNGSFAAIGADALRGLLTGVELNRPLNEGVDYVMGGMNGLGGRPAPSNLKPVAAPDLSPRGLARTLGDGPASGRPRGPSTD